MLKVTACSVCSKFLWESVTDNEKDLAKEVEKSFRRRALLPTHKSQ